jgi:hypothetical protein
LLRLGLLSILCDDFPKGNLLQFLDFAVPVQRRKEYLVNVAIVEQVRLVVQCVFDSLVNLHNMKAVIAYFK